MVGSPGTALGPGRMSLLHLHCVCLEEDKQLNTLNDFIVVLLCSLGEWSCQALSNTDNPLNTTQKTLCMNKQTSECNIHTEWVGIQHRHDSRLELGVRVVELWQLY